MILDTNALSAMADGDIGLAKLLDTATELAIPVITLGEYRYGITQSRYRRRYEDWLSDLIAICRILPADEQTSAHYAEIRGELRRAGKPIPANDAWIAAIARQHKMPVVSRDEHFDNVPKLKRLAW